MSIHGFMIGFAIGAIVGGAGFAIGYICAARAYRDAAADLLARHIMAERRQRRASFQDPPTRHREYPR